MERIASILAEPSSYEDERAPAYPGSAAELRALFDALSRLPVYVYWLSGPPGGPMRVRGFFGDPEPVLGRDRDELIGMDASELPHPDEVEQHEAVVFAAIASGDYYETMGRAAPIDDEERWFFSMSGIEVREDEMTLLGVTLKSRELAGLQAQLREKAQRLEDLTANIPGTVYQWRLLPDGTMQIPYVSEGVKHVIGNTAEEVLAEPDILSRYIVPEDLPGVNESILRSAETQEPWHRVYRAKLPSGEVKTLFGASRPSRLADGSTLWNGITFDFTEVERRNAEQRQRDLAELEVQKLESLGRLASGVAHDVNNLLVGVLGNAGVLMESLDGEDAAIAHEIELAAQRCAELTEQVLAFAGRSQAKNEVLDLVSLVDEMVRLSRSGRDAGVVLTLENDQRAARVSGDATQLGQVILNLLTNAFESGARHVTVKLGNEASQAVLMVEDDGVGIPAEVVERIFEPFFTTKPKGRGLGLASSSGIIRAHGGDISVSSTVGEGSRFCLTLPLSEGAVATHDAQPSAAAAGGRILLVDDEEHVLHATERLLCKLGFEVVSIGNGSEALDRFRADGRFDYVVLDLTMPQPGGAEVFEGIRRIAPEQPVVFFSGYSEAQVDALTSSRRNVTFLHKPFTRNALLEALGRVKR